MSRATAFQYDAHNRPTRITDARNAPTNMGYGLAGRFTSVTDGVSNVTAFGYDNADRLSQVQMTVGRQTAPTRSTTDSPATQLAQFRSCRNARGRDNGE